MRKKKVWYKGSNSTCLNNSKSILTWHTLSFRTNIQNTIILFPKWSMLCFNHHFCVQKKKINNNCNNIEIIFNNIEIILINNQSQQF